MVHARLVIKAIEISRRNQLDQVSVAFVVLAEQHKMIRAFGIGAAALVIVRRNVHLAADDRLHAMRRRLVIKSRSRKKIAVIGHGDGGHFAPRSFGCQFADFTGAVEKRVVRVQMQMYKVRGGHSEAILNQRRAIGNRQFDN